MFGRPVPLHPVPGIRTQDATAKFWGLWIHLRAKRSPPSVGPR